LILLVRHGRTRANASGLLQGRADLALDELGRAQAAALAVVLPRGAAVITSPLTRARQTAAVIAEAGGGQVVVDERWIELDYGEWDGRQLGDVPPGTWERWRADIDFAPPGGESLAGCGGRVRQVCTELAERAEDQDIVVVSHVSPIKAAVAWALGVGDETSWRMFLSVASICRISVSERGTSLRSYNEQAHLDGVSHPVSHQDSLR
jgi:broad specificity phosphatase PhoE